MKINEKIYSLRKEANLSQEELADKLNVSRQTVSKWELGESCPDFDKILPLCEVFGISTEELLKDKKSINNDNDKPDTKKAALISVSILLYFVAIISIIFGETYLHLDEGITVSLFLLICGIATVIIVYTCMTRTKKVKVKEDEETKKENLVLKSVIDIISLLTTAIYLLVSFYTGAWHITWIIWIIYSLIVNIVKLIFNLKGDVVDEE